MSKNRANLDSAGGKTAMNMADQTIDRFIGRIGNAGITDQAAHEKEERDRDKDRVPGGGVEGARDREKRPGFEQHREQDCGPAKAEGHREAHEQHDKKNKKIKRGDEFEAHAIPRCATGSRASGPARRFARCWKTSEAGRGARLRQKTGTPKKLDIKARAIRWTSRCLCPRTSARSRHPWRSARTAWQSRARHPRSSSHAFCRPLHRRTR